MSDPRWIKARLLGAVNKQDTSAVLYREASQWREAGMWSSARHCQELAASDAWTARLWAAEGMAGRYLTPEEMRDL